MGDPTFDGGGVIVSHHEAAPRRTPSHGAVSSSPTRSALICLVVSQGKGTVWTDLVRHVDSATIVA